MHLKDIVDNVQYWHGPAWLLNPDSEVIATNIVDADISNDKVYAQEFAKTKTLALTCGYGYGDNLFSRFSQYSKIVQVIARILPWRFHKETKMLDKSCRPDLIGPDEFKRTENFVFSLVQRNEFTSDFAQLCK